MEGYGENVPKTPTTIISILKKHLGSLSFHGFCASVREWGTIQMENEEERELMPVRATIDRNDM